MVAPPMGPNYNQEARLQDASQLAMRGLTIGALAGAGYFAYNNPDQIARYGRFVGNMSPFQFYNTLGVPEWASLGTSPQYKGLNQVGNQFEYVFDPEFLHNKSTEQYLSKLTGLSRTDLDAQLGLTNQLVYKQGQAGVGQLFVRKGNEDSLLANNIRLQALTKDSANLIESPLASKHGINSVSQSIMQAMGLFNDPSFSQYQAFKNADGVTSKFMPVNALSVDMSIDGMSRGTTLLRAMPAWGMTRFNRLARDTASMFMPAQGVKYLEKMGLGTYVRPGTASEMFGRFGMAAAGIGAAYVGLQQIDYYRRNLPGVGNIASSGVVAGGIGLGISQVFGGRAGAIAGVTSFAGQLMLPGFDQGIPQGLATTYASVNVARGSAVNPFHYYRRTVEGFVPGISSLEAGIGISALALGASYMTLPDGKTGARHLRERFNLGFGPEETMPTSVNNKFYELISDHNLLDDFDNIDSIRNNRTVSWRQRYQMLNHVRNKQGADSAVDFFNKQFSLAEEAVEVINQNNPVTKAMMSRLEDVAAKYEGSTSIVSRAAKHIESLSVQTGYSFFGAGPGKVKEEIAAMGLRAPLGRAGLLLAAPMLMHSLVTGSLFGTMETAEELEDIYSGRKMVEIKRARWWAAGGQPLDGLGTSYFRPHMVALINNRTKEQAIWGEDADNYSPAARWFLKNFTYHLEDKNQYSRPYPLSAGAFSDIPFIGGLLSSTVGRLIKPVRPMREEEWDYTDLAVESGGYGSVRHPQEGLTVADSMAYQFREMSGLPGFYAGTLLETLFGTDSAVGGPVLATASDMYSSRDSYWGMELGEFPPGIAEIARRIFPSRRDVDKGFNPLYNDQPSWMPKHYHKGDPGTKAANSYIFAPGLGGYESLYPELRGVHPEDYSDIHKFNILARLAPNSRELRRVRQRLYDQRDQGLLTDEEIQMLDYAEHDIQKKINFYNFEDDPNQIRLPGSGITRSIAKFIGETARTITAPAEYLQVFGYRPLQKLTGRGMDPIEQYEWQHLYGSEQARWDKLYSDFLRPAALSAAHMFGYSGIPGERREYNFVEDYYDQVQFAKYMNLASTATNGTERLKYEREAANTMYGVNPYGHPMSVYFALPEQERAYFNAFLDAKGSDRIRILEMVPQNTRYIYEIMWQRIDKGEDIFAAPENIDKKYLYQKYGQMDTSGLPPVDWVGTADYVDINDIKTKYIVENRYDPIKFGVSKREIAKTENLDYVLDTSTDFMYSSDFRGRAMDMIERNVEINNTYVRPAVGPSGYSVDAYDNRDRDIRSYLGGW